MYHELRASGITQYSEWLAKNTPVLFTTYNRIEFTKKTLPILLKSTCGQIIVIDNNSTDGTQEWLKEQEGIKLILNEENVFVAGAMNQFFDLTENNEYVAKVDNDTIVKKDWLVKLLENSLLNDVDIVQAKHPLISDTHPKGFDDWVKNFPQKGTIRLNEFVGGSGVVIKRKVIKEKLNTTLGVLSSWTHWQHQHKEVYKGFDTSVEIKLLDTEYGSKANYNKYKDYYIFTGREKKKKLDIGSGNWKFEGYETLDNDPIVEPNILADIEDKIPAKDETYDEIRCHHILEHIETKNKVKVMGELWRILKTGGILDIEVPNFPSPQSIQDPTHVSFWNSESFRYFLKSDSLYENFHKRYSQYTVPTFERLSEELESGWIYRTKLKKI
jgi:glycosyltransferase involved in cell wall biosynthesis